MLLKIGTRYIETGAITSIFDDGDSITVYFNVTNDGDAARISFKGDEYTALLRWLDANSTDIMTTQPAPVETPRKFKEGDRVRVTKSVVDEDDRYIGEMGVLVADQAYGECWVRFDNFPDDDLMVPEQLELIAAAQTIAD